MIENLINLIRQNAGDAITNNPAIPNERNEEAVKETGNSILSSLQGALSGGNIKDVIGMFTNGTASDNNPVVRQASGNLMDKLKQQFGLNTDQAAGIAGTVVPNVMNQLAQKTADPNDKSFDVQDIFNQLSGGKTSGMNVQGMLSKFKGGLDKDGDGDVDLQDLKSVFSGGGSVMDKVKGMFN
ncbi:MAG TPA: DUF937 domain-containing protein [Chitinophagaceae bacterium]